MRNPWIRRVLGSVTAQSSLFLVEREGVLSLVDAGGAGCVRHVLAAIRRAGRRPEDVRHIVLTHCHGDHTGEAKRLKGLTGAILVAGTADAGVIDGSEPYPRPPGSLFRTVYRRLERFPRAAVDLRIDGREDLDGGLVVIPSPGHTAGHLAVLVPDLGALLVGDAVWHLGPLRPSWRQVTADRPLNEASIRQLGSLPGVDRVYMGHGAPISGDRFRAFARDL